MAEDTKREGEARESAVAYPEYRVRPGERVSLAAIDADESEHYARKKEVLGELERQRRRI